MLRGQLQDELDKYIPKSDMVKKVLLDGKPTATNIVAKEGWGEYLAQLADDVESGDRRSLVELLEIVYYGAHNEGMIEATDEDMLRAHERA